MKGPYFDHCMLRTFSCLVIAWHNYFPTPSYKEHFPVNPIFKNNGNLSALTLRTENNEQNIS